MKRYGWIAIGLGVVVVAAGVYPFSKRFLTARSKTGEKVGSSMSRSEEGRERRPGGVAGRNRLANEKSPYLLQHADNPVDWYPWGDEAFEKAARENKPVFLSIGYSTCHWCHVMEHESFEDSTVAALMNSAFVNIKVDREERPDIDNVYMTVCQMMTGSGGWPLTIVMTPDKKPFFAATYIPKDDRFGRTGMTNLVPMIEDVWKNRRDEVNRSSDQIAQHLKEFVSGGKEGETLGADVLNKAFEQLNQRFDGIHGGFGMAPKFPTPHNLLFLLRYWKRTGNGRALEIVEKTMTEMSRGGIYDHVGFGFHRYSTDERWFAPHFEKMLYDQALLIMAFTELFQATGKPEYMRTAREIIAYVLRDMTDPRGGFYSAEDADSEGKEGKFYLWTEAEVRNVLGGDDAALVVDLYGVEPSGNFSEEVPGGNILHLRRPIDAVAAERKVSEAALRERLESIRQKLFEAREKRVHPHKDDKILTDWNGLMIAALAKAAAVFDDARYEESARKALDFILDTMRDKKGRLLHRYRDGEAAIKGNADDYAFLIWGMIELYGVSFDVRLLKTALDLNKDLIDRFWDKNQGGLYFSAADSENMIVRMKEAYDSAIPSGNSVAMLNFIRLGRMTADATLESLADRIGRAFEKKVSQTPGAFTLLLAAVDFAVGPSYEVVLVGDPAKKDTQALQDALNRSFSPNKVVLLKPLNGKKGALDALAPYTKPHVALNGEATAYVCVNYACELPTTRVDQMLELLSHTPK